MSTAKDRAEELLHGLQKRARDLLAAEEGLAHTVRELVENRGLSPAEVRKRLETMVGRIKANKVWERIRTSEAVVALSDYRDELERRVEETVRRLLATFQIVTKNDLTALKAELSSLEKKLENLKKQVKTEAE